MAEITARTAIRRRARDRLLTFSVRSAGLLVLGAVFLILVYLIWVCLPLAMRSEVTSYSSLDLEPGLVHAVRESDGSLWRLDLPGAPLLSQGTLQASSANRAVVAHDGKLHFYDLVSVAEVAGSDVRFAGRLRRSVVLRNTLADGIQPTAIAFDSFDGRGLVAMRTEDGALHALNIDIEGGANATPESWTTHLEALDAGRVLVDARALKILVVDGNRYAQWQIPRLQTAGTPLLSGGQLAGIGGKSTAVSWGPGRETLLVATATSELHRFDWSRPGLAPMGTPRLDLGRIVWIGSESQRRLTALHNDANELVLLVPTTGDVLFRRELENLAPGDPLGLSTNGSVVYSLHGEVYRRWDFGPGAPDTSWRSLWQAQRYGAYDAPAHVWHPDGASIGVLPKYGLSPLLWGTFKAAIYGMFVAVPLALGAAIYTGYFLPPRRRNQVKPAVEMLEAFPTVVLGFIAGLWLAPLLGEYLMFVLIAPLVLLLVPLILAATHRLAQRLSLRFVRRPPRLPLLVVVYGAGFLVLALQAETLEVMFFDGSVRDWLWRSLGLRYDQRNALLVGFAMGLAITPVMFSIVEDAINAVPRRLSDGSLALGATRWQSLWRVVLPAASPAVLSALLIGFARGLGETMIVLLATGNAPLMEADPFSGLRSLAANIAVELPEAGAGGVHFRLLFLAALVLFLLTFTLNTLAEFFRQRLRYAYAGR